MFYVYEISIVATGEVIYVGKGTGNRYKAKKKNKLLNRLLQDNECDFKKTKYFNTETEAFEAERQRINELKAIGQAICNNATYTTGGVSKYWTEEKRKEKSINNPMKDIKQRERMSRLNPMKNEAVAKEVAEKNKLAFVIEDREYKGLSEAAVEYGVTNACISYWLNRGYTSDNKKCYRLSENENISNIGEIDVSHVIVYDGKEYKTMKDLGDAIGKSPQSISRWLKKGFSPSGIPCRYKDDNTEYTFKGKNNHFKKPILVDGVRYESLIEASKHTGYSAKNISYYLTKAKNPPIKCEYVK